MGLKGNVFDEQLFVFFDALKGLRLGSHVGDTQSQNNRTVLNQALERARSPDAGSAPTDAISVGVSYDLYVPNHFEGSSLSYGSTHCKNEEMLALVTELSRRYQAITVCMVYEAVERFLKAFAPPLFFSAREWWPPADRQRFHRRQPSFANWL